MEMVCFFFLGRLPFNAEIFTIAALTYDAAAFVPQGLIGFLKDKYPAVRIDLIGWLSLSAGFVLRFNAMKTVWPALVLLSLGNAALHIFCAELTLRHGQGKTAPSAIFVSGGSFGLIVGRILAGTDISWIWMICPLFIILSVSLFASKQERIAAEEERRTEKLPYDLHNRLLPEELILAAAVLLTAVRAYMGYGIPTSWNKTVWQSVALYMAMGTGKALGGILTDRFGIRKTMYTGILAAMPFLLLGDRIMWVSLIGVLFFSMTMGGTLGILVSALPDLPGTAFGLMTVGLFLGTLPIFVVRLNSYAVQAAAVVICTFLSILCAGLILPKRRKSKEN